MKMHRLFLAGLFLLPLLLFSFSTDNAFRWVKLGSQKVNYQLDKDVIYVSPMKGQFTHLKLNLNQGRINMHKVRVVYGNGQETTYPITRKMGPNQRTCVIDLKGKRRNIAKIVLWYDTDNRSQRKGILTVFGLRI